MEQDLVASFDDFLDREDGAEATQQRSRTARRQGNLLRCSQNALKNGTPTKAETLPHAQLA